MTPGGNHRLGQPWSRLSTRAVRQRLARHPWKPAANRRGRPWRRSTLVAAARRGLAWLWPAAQAERRPPPARPRPTPAGAAARRLLAGLRSAADRDARRAAPWRTLTAGARGGLARLRLRAPTDPRQRLAQLRSTLTARARQRLAGLWPAAPAERRRPRAWGSPRTAAEGRWRLGARRMAAVAVVLALCAVMAVWSTEESSASTPEFPPAAFYQVPERLPAPAGQPGQLIRSLEIKGPAATRGARAWVILYHSRSMDGHDVAVSGLVVAPPGDRPEPRPVVAWAHPTTGLADRCTPSHLGVDGIATLRGYWLGELLRRGYVVVATDYEGLGTPGLHPYLVGASEGHSVLDAVRAAGRLRDARAGGPVALWGFSEGGHAVLWAGELAAWHDVYGAPLDVLTPQGRAAVERLRTFCPPAAARTPPALRSDPRAVPAWRALLDRNAAGQAPIPAPVLIAQGGAEGAAPLRVVTRIGRRLCGFGTETALRTYPGVHHGQVVDASGGDVLAWLDARVGVIDPGGSPRTAPPGGPPIGYLGGIPARASGSCGGILWVLGGRPGGIAPASAG